MPDKAMLINCIDVAELIDAIADEVERRLSPHLQTARPPELVDVAEMARLASVSSTTIDRLRKRGAIPSVKIGDRRLFCPSRVLQALEAD